MRIIPGIQGFQAPLKGSVLTIGNFDGVHRGHRELLERVVALARQLRVPSVVMTFDPHPVKVLHPDRQLKRLFSFDDQRQQLEMLGIDFLVVEPFSREFSQVAPELFVRHWMIGPFDPKKVIIGYDFSFGANRAGSLELMQEQAQKSNFEIEIIPPFTIDENVVSSTLIRKCLAAGDVATARRYLGRSFYLEGLIERGAGRGRTIGVPTANLQVHAETLPKIGVYAVRVELQNHPHRPSRRFEGVCNIGRNPTFNFEDSPISVECHIFDFAEDIYGSPMRIEFVERLRDEMKFSSAAELVGQIQTDIRHGQKILAQDSLQEKL